MAELEIRKFRLEDFPEYQSWFADPDLNAQLGPMEKENPWLSVLQKQDGIEYSVFRDQELVAVLGITFPDDQHLGYYITDLAVKPSLRSQGIGTSVLHKVIERHPLAHGQAWRAFVHVSNPRVRAWLERNQWLCETETPEEGMYSYIYAGA